MKINQIYKLSEEEVINYRYLGTAAGTFKVCVHMAEKHVPNFWNRVAGCRIAEEGPAEMVKIAIKKAGLQEEECVNIAFYERKVPVL